MVAHAAVNVSLRRRPLDRVVRAVGQVRVFSSRPVFCSAQVAEWCDAGTTVSQLRVVYKYDLIPPRLGHARADAARSASQALQTELGATRLYSSTNGRTIN